jgi:hypothetical protein
MYDGFQLRRVTVFSPATSSSVVIAKESIATVTLVGLIQQELQ